MVKRPVPNRNNVSKLVDMGEVTGRSLEECARNIAKLLGCPKSSQVILDILKGLASEYRIELRHCKLRLLSGGEIHEKRILAREQAQRRLRTKQRSLRRRKPESVKDEEMASDDDNQDECAFDECPEAWKGFDPDNPDITVSKLSSTTGGWDELDEILTDQVNDDICQAKCAHPEVERYGTSTKPRKRVDRSVVEKIT